jgi:integrase/recombinase XerD
MKNSSKPIIEHIPLFLNYCIEEGLSDKTFENYKNYLKRFITWLKKENKSTLLPHELTSTDANAYISYLSCYKDKKGQALKKVTQNYYLIALRAILGYFVAKDIVSIPPDKITLPKVSGGEKTIKFLNLEQIERLLEAPDTSNPAGLRDKAILAVLIFSGLKVAQLQSLNRDQLEQTIPGEALGYVKKYLETRKDSNKALFIHFRSRKDAENRLIARSIERIVKKYAVLSGIPFFTTPEILRWARALALSNKEIKIQKICIHQTLVTEKYKNKDSLLIYQKKSQNLSPTWNVIENIINKEITWLKDNIPTLPHAYKNNPSFLKYDDSILRKIAILIVSGKIEATEIVTEENKNLWGNLIAESNLNKVSRHGQEWHKKMMDVIYEYFKSQGCKVALEPILNYGRADLGIYSSSSNPLLIEVDTVSLFKLWYNLSVMKSVTFLIVPSEDKVIEFNT